jgi:hypothetical protein
MVSEQGAEDNIWTQEITGGQRKLHNMELHNCNSSIKNTGGIMGLAELTA